MTVHATTSVLPDGNWDRIIEHAKPAAALIRSRLSQARGSLRTFNIQPLTGCLPLNRVRRQDPAKSFGIAVILFGPINHLSIPPVKSGLVALSDRHRVGERKPSCPDQDGAYPYQNRVRP